MFLVSKNVMNLDFECVFILNLFRGNAVLKCLECGYEAVVHHINCLVFFQPSFIPTQLRKPVEETDTHSTQTEYRNGENVLAVGHGEGNVLLRMVKVKLYGNNTVLETVALCDEASSVTLLDKSIANRLGLDGTPQPLCIQWTNNLSSRHEDSSCLKFKISGVFSGAKIFSMRNVRTVENLALPVQEIRRSDWERYSHLEGIPFHEISERPMILLGQDNIHLTVARKVIQSTENEPIATKTNLGWILHGGNSIEQDKQAYSFHICSSEISDISLHEMVKQSFTTDAFGVIPKKTNINKAEARAIDIMKSSSRGPGSFPFKCLFVVQFKYGLCPSIIIAYLLLGTREGII
ncbi:hypothetical protein JTB14_024013 [Gonioctena quinquepunctata]|nr:hypothetical protein JTB14_024013 [Gonioctena quinquepunctata]